MDEFHRRMRSLHGSLASVNTLFRSLKRAQAIVTRWFTGTIRSQSPACKTPRYLKNRKLFSSSSSSLTVASSSCPACLFRSYTNLSAPDPARDAAFGCGCAMQLSAAGVP